MRAVILLCAVLLIAGAGYMLIFATADRRIQAEFTFISGPLRTLDPQRTSMLRDFRIIDVLYDRLTRLSHETGEPVPAMAERWQISEDGRTYTFHLREDARWSNGDPVRAEEFILGWRRAMMPDFAAYYRTMFDYIEGAEDWFTLRNEDLQAYADRPAAQRSEQAAKQLLETHLEAFEREVGLEAPDDHTLIITLEKPVPYFLDLTAFMTFSPQHAPSMAEAMLDPDEDTGMVRMRGDWLAPDKLITNGPYFLAEHRPNRHLLLEASEHYYDREAMTSASIGVRILETGPALRSYEGGHYDWWPDVPTAHVIAGDLYQQKQDGDRDDVHVFDEAATSYAVFNVQDEYRGEANPFADRHIRRAFAKAIDVDQIIADIMRKQERKSHSLVPPGMIPGYEPPQDVAPRFAPEAAARMLEAYDGEVPSVTILYRTGTGQNAMAERVARQWRDHLEADVTIEGVPHDVFVERLKEGRFMFTFANWFADYRDPTSWLNMYRSGDGNNHAKWANDDYDRILAEAAEITDPERRMSMLEDAERLLLREAPIVPMFIWRSIELYDPQRVRNLDRTPWTWPRLDRVEVTRPER